MKTNALTDLLVADLQTPTPRLSRRLTKALIFGALLTAALFFATMGVRPDFAAAMEKPRVLLKFAFAFSLLAASFSLALNLAKPGVPVKSWVYALFAAPALLLVGIAAEIESTPAASWLPGLIGVNAKYCLTLIPLFAIARLALSCGRCATARPPDQGSPARSRGCSPAQRRRRSTPRTAPTTARCSSPLGIRWPFPSSRSPAIFSARACCAVTAAGLPVQWISTGIPV